MKIALLQLNPTVGDIEGNAAAILTAARKAASLGAELCLTPELALLGYPPRDLLLNRSFVARGLAAAARLAADLAGGPDGGPALIVGLAEPNPDNECRPLFNSAAFLAGGQVRTFFRKSLLPTYDVFDEDRYFEPGESSCCLDFQGLRLGVTICEDVWNDRDFWSARRYHVDPVARLLPHHPQILLNLSASPFTLGKQTLRERMLSGLAAKYRLPVLYVNQVGGNDDLVFAGRSVAFAPDGRLIGRAAAFAEDILLVDTATMTSTIAPDDFSEESETWRALVLGTRDYARKCGFTQCLLGLSGGIDSAVTAVIAAHALGPDNVQGVLMPSPYSSRGSIDDALALAANLGIPTRTIPIEPVMRTFAESLAPAFAGLPEDVTEENIQSRIRGNLLMAMSNKFRSLLLTTGNKSELAVGYCTIYGDMSGGLAVISDVPKTLIYRLSAWINANIGPVIPEAIIGKAPSAELRPDQTDQDSLPPYDILDAILHRHVEEYQSEEEIVEAGFDPATVRRVVWLVRLAEFKRRQAAPGLKITPRAFGTGWRMPVARR